MTKARTAIKKAQRQLLRLVNERDKPKYIYLFHFSDNSRIKVGQSVNPASRLKIMEGSSGCKVTSSFWLKSEHARQIEKDVLESLKAHQSVGEWFDDDERLFNRIQDYIKVGVKNDSNNKALHQ